MCLVDVGAVQVPVMRKIERLGKLRWFRVSTVEPCFSRMLRFAQTAEPKESRKQNIFM